jgi:hypothetical protein
MGKAEEKYKYLLNKEKYDPKIQQAVSSKRVSMSEANKLNSIQEMMQKERQLRTEHLGMQDGNVGEHNTGRNDSVFYEHKRGV